MRKITKYYPFSHLCSISASPSLYLTSDFHSRSCPFAYYMQQFSTTLYIVNNVAACCCICSFSLLKSVYGCLTWASSSSSSTRYIKTRQRTKTIHVKRTHTIFHVFGWPSLHFKFTTWTILSRHVVYLYPYSCACVSVYISPAKHAIRKLCVTGISVSKNFQIKEMKERERAREEDTKKTRNPNPKPKPIFTVWC